VIPIGVPVTARNEVREPVDSRRVPPRSCRQEGHANSEDSSDAEGPSVGALNFLRGVPSPLRASI